VPCIPWRPDRPRQRPMEPRSAIESLNKTPLRGVWPPGPTPLPCILWPPPARPLHASAPALALAAPGTARPYSERCCGIPASRARTSVSLYRRCPPSVRIDVSLPAFAHRVTVFGSTLNIVATSAGVSSGSASGVRADMCTASPPGPVLRSCVLLQFLAPLGSLPWMSHMVYSETILPSPAVTSRPPGAKFL
jgi:hypothetical protein